MKYDKLPLSFKEQADNLIQLGLIADKTFLINCLENVGYYRLDSYFHPFYQHNGTLKSGTTLECVWQRYTFDRQLRIIVMDAIERVEVSVRTQLVYALVHNTGTFGYLNATTLPNITEQQHAEWLGKIKREAERSQEEFIKPFKCSRSRVLHSDLPIWMISELMSFGTMVTLYRGMSFRDKQDVARHYKIPDKVLYSWLQALNVVRNICAHHARLWNRELGYKPKLPTQRKYPEWHSPIIIPNNKLFSILTILRYCLGKIAIRSGWKDRLLCLLRDYPQIHLHDMGFPEHWQNSPLWK